MDTKNNYGIIIRHLRKQAGLSVQKLARKIGKSAGWVSEIENNTGTSRLSEKEFERVVQLLDGSRHREMFRTWVANHHNAERIDRTYDGAVIKYIRLKKEISLKKAANLTGLSQGYLCKLECGVKPLSAEMRKRLMAAYGYNPSSFKNLSTDPVRSKAVPRVFKLRILLRQMSGAQIEALHDLALGLISSGT